MTADDIKDYITYAVEPTELCELLGFSACVKIARRIRAERQVLGYEPEPYIDIEGIIDGLL